MNDVRFALYSIKKNIRSSAELRSSFLMNVFGMALNDIAFIILWIFFVRSVGVVGGWTGAEIIGLMGFSAFSFGVIMSVFRGIFILPDYVASGSFDRFMLSPKNLLLRVATSSFLPSAVGDVIFGLVCLIIYGSLIQIGLPQALLLLLLMLMTCVVFFAVLVIIFSTSFLFIDSYTVTNSIFNLFMGPSLFPGGAFQGAMRFIFTFIIPSLLIGGIPVEILKNASWPTLAVVGSFSAILFALALFIFPKAVRKYESSNFMTFGN
jgi:ABC-2 type transport system permease protein